MRPENSDYVLCVCSREYRNRIEGRVAADVGKGVFWEGTLLYNALYEQKGHGPRFIAVLMAGAQEAHVPQILGGYTRFRLSSFELADPQCDYARLYRLLTGQSGSRSSGPGRLKKLEPLPEKLRRTDFAKLKETLIRERERPEPERWQPEGPERFESERPRKEVQGGLEAKQRQAERLQEQEQEGLRAEREDLEAERREQGGGSEVARRQRRERVATTSPIAQPPPKPGFGDG